MEQDIGKSSESLLSLCRESVSFGKTMRCTYKHHSSLLSICDLEKHFELIFQENLYFSKKQDYEKICALCKKAYEKKEYEEKYLWLGAFYEEEMEKCLIPPVEIRWISMKMGYGLFADADVAPHQYVGEYTGEVRRRRWVDQKNPYCFEYYIDGKNSSYLIDARERGNHTRFINHAIVANLTPHLIYRRGVMHVIFVANQFIPKGTEFTYDYGPNYWKKRESPQTT